MDMDNIKTLASVKRALRDVYAWQDGMTTSAWLNATLQALGAAQ
jgi:hypothetical protein